jgi:ATP-dependent RNA helicase RhlB
MPKHLYQKVRSIFKKSSEKKDVSSSPLPAEAPQTTGRARKASGSKRSASVLKEETPDTPVPPDLENVRKKRAPQPEEWRPGRSGDQKPSEKKSNGERSEKSSRSGQRRRSGGRSSGGDRNRRGRSSDRKDGSSGNTRGKGFSFPRSKPDAGEWTREQYQVAEQEGKTRFADLELDDRLIHAIADLGYEYCTPIQSGILPDLIKGRDGLGQAQTGTGKTAAFLLASLNHLLRTLKPDQPNGSPRMLVLAPTRELVLQIEAEAADLMKYTPLQSLPVYGGLDYEPQKEALRHHQVDLVVATPGRLIDFMRSRVVDLSKVEILVLDEADRMLDMGFIPDVKRIVYATPHKKSRQTLFFSATFTDDIRRLAGSWTEDPASVVIEPESVADTVDQTVFIVTDDQKFALTVNMLRNFKPTRTLIFANRRDTSQDLCDHLNVYGFKAALLSGAVPQAKRVKTLEAFKDGSMPIVVATDVAGRGIHVDEVGLVINYNLPEDPEDYVHRIGRTGRAGEEGRSVCFASEFDSMMLPDIEKYIGRELVCTHPEEEWLTVEERELPKRAPRRSQGGGRGGSGGGRRGGRSGGRSGGPRGRSGGGRRH